MTPATWIGAHEVRIFDGVPLLVYIRLDGDLSTGEARQLSHHIAQRVDDRGGRFLVDSTALGTIRLSSRRELVAAGADNPTGTVSILDIVVVGATMLQKVVMTQIVTMAHLHPDSRGQTHFFDALDDALAWLGLPKDLLTR